jgi:dynein heavy chain
LSASKEVEELDVRCKAQQVNLLRTEQENNVLMGQMTEAKEATDKKMEEASQYKIEIANSLEEIKVSNEIAVQALNEALPLREKAQRDVQNLDPKEYANFKAMTNPPVIIKEVGRLICALFNEGEGEESWGRAKVYMADPGFLSRMKDFNVRAQCKSDAKLRRVNRIIKSIQARSEEFKRAGIAAAQLFSWGDNTYQYALVNKEIQPKEAEVERLELNRKKGEADYVKIQEELKTLREEQAKLSQKLKQGKAKQEEVQRQKDQLEKRLNAAQRLTAGFTSEHSR